MSNVSYLQLEEEEQGSDFYLEHYESIDEPSKFLSLNSMLPSGKRFKPTPQSSANMNYVDVTKEGLVTCFPVRHEHAAMLRQTLNFPPNASYRAFK
jgi:hypothetical protein